MRVDLYTRESLERQRRTNRILSWVLLLLSALFLTVCILLCTRVTTLNAACMEKAVIVTAVAGGWLVLALALNLWIPGRREAEHAAHVADADREAVSGTVIIGKERVQIPASIRVRKVSVETESGSRQLFLNESKRRQFPKTPVSMTLYTAGRYIVGFERREEE